MDGNIKYGFKTNVALDKFGSNLHIQNFKLPQFGKDHRCLMGPKHTISIKLGTFEGGGLTYFKS